MRNNDVLWDRLIFLLAGSGMTEDQILRVLRKIAVTPSFQIVEQVLFCRSAMSEHQMGGIEIPVSADAHQSTNIDRDAVDTIERLLVMEAGLPKFMAARALSDALESRNPGLYIPAFNPKHGFANWLRQVANIVPLGEIMHIAAALRNQYVHLPTDDWLKGWK